MQLTAHPVNYAPPPPINTEEKEPKSPTEPCPPPTCALCDVQGHATQNYPYFPILLTHMCIVVESNESLVVNVPTIPAVKKKSLQTNHSCVIYGYMVITPIISQTFLITGFSSVTFASTLVSSKSLTLKKSTLRPLPRTPTTPFI